MGFSCHKISKNTAGNLYQDHGEIYTYQTSVQNNENSVVYFTKFLIWFEVLKASRSWQINSTPNLSRCPQTPMLLYGFVLFKISVWFIDLTWPSCVSFPELSNETVMPQLATKHNYLCHFLTHIHLCYRSSSFINYFMKQTYWWKTRKQRWALLQLL